MASWSQSGGLGIDSATLRKRRRPRVVGAVHAMAEAHQPLLAVERVVEPRLGVLGRADLGELVDDLAIGAPPWSGPFIVPIAPTTAEAMSERVEMTTRAVNVEALKLCSAPTMK